MSDYPWCEMCQCYHKEESPHVGQIMEIVDDKVKDECSVLQSKVDELEASITMYRKAVCDAFGVKVTTASQELLELIKKARHLKDCETEKERAQESARWWGSAAAKQSASISNLEKGILDALRLPSSQLEFEKNEILKKALDTSRETYKRIFG